ncbi:cytochrome C oxidase subunit IV family protein [Massilia sp. YIM B02763]|uniref:cytochrome C oxidase subunit IV family protein n=1 Tax=Massilia sp. YIM B02763 TaxID=3050130 RepID=UPI0025B6778B|nr:cytochrome C oxidase subunit IV family protein [Massilia sp. YIM B02763]MDN4051645.1 cytochrome C oxidase subunit IV family protein [Massilia sp. YIM B02763]
MDKEAKPLLLAWAALMVLLALSAGTAFIPLGWVNTALGMAIALAKAVLVALVFMRLRRSPALLRIAAVVGAVTMLVLFGLSATDYATRSVLPAVWQQPATVPARAGGS